MGLCLLDLSDAKAAALKMQFDDGEPSTFDNPTPALVQSLIGFPSASGAIVTKDSAIRCATFLSGVKELANDVAKMPLLTYERSVDADGRQSTKKAFKHPLWSLLKDSPNPWSTAFQVAWAIVFHLHTNGNFYVQKIRNGLGQIVGLMVLNPWCVTQRWEYPAGGQPVMYFQYQDGHMSKRFETGDLWWGSILSASGIQGQAIITLGKEVIGMMIASDSTAGKFYANGLNMSGFLTSPPDIEITEVEAQNAVDRLRDQNRINRGGFTFLPGGIKYEKLQFTPAEAQLLEGRKWQAEEIIRLLGGAPLLVKLGYGDKNATYASSAAFLEEYFSTSLLPITTLLEQTAARDLLQPEEKGTIYFKHYADVVLRGSPKDRADTFASQINSGQRSPNECRELDDMDHIDGLDYFHINTNCIFKDGELITVGVRGVGTQDEPGAGAPPELTPNVQPPDAQAPPKAEVPARIRAIAEAAAERVLRANAKGKADDKFVSDVLGVTLEEAKNCPRTKEALVALVLGEGK